MGWISPVQGHRSIHHHSVAFADDTDGQISCDTTETMSLTCLVRKLQHSGQTWNNLTNICGGLIAHHKCIMWQLLAWERKAGHLHPLHQPGKTLVLQDSKGAYAVITDTLLDEPNVGLGIEIPSMPGWKSASTLPLDIIINSTPLQSNCISSFD